MIINADTSKNISSLHFGGEIDVVTAGQLREAGLAALTSAVDELHIDLEGVTFTDCSGVSALLEIRNEAVASGATVILDRPSPAVVRILRLTGLRDVFLLDAGNGRSDHSRPPKRGNTDNQTAAPHSEASQGVINLALRLRKAWTQGDPATSAPELLPVRLARACVAVLPVSGAGLSVMNDDFRVPLGASDDVSQAAERLQFIQGEGPCLDAARSGRVVIAQAEQIQQRWPAFGDQFAQQTPFRAVISIPLPLTADLRGALDLYLTATDPVEAVSLAATTIIGDEIVQALLIAQALTGTVNPRSEELEPPSLTVPVAETARPYGSPWACS
jgi:anti-anti-sigma factor